MSLFSRFALAALAASLALAGPAGAQQFDSRKTDPSVLRILVHVSERGGPEQCCFLGSGFVIADGYVATNNHVVGDNDRHKVTKVEVVTGHKQTLPAKVIWTSPGLDLGVIRVEGLNRPVVPLTGLTAPDYPVKGHTVFLQGFPGAVDTLVRDSKEAQHTSTVSRGVVGRIVTASFGGTLRPVIQHDTEAGPGNSGGPLFDGCGSVVGVHTFSERAKLQIVKDERGNEIALGALPRGALYAPHIQNLIGALRTEAALKGIAFRTVDTPCAEFAGGEGMPMAGWIAIGGAGFLGLAGLMMAVLRPRQTVRVVESYSAWVKRKGRKVGDPRSGMVGAGGTAGAPTGGAAIAAARSAPAESTGRGPAAAGAWTLAGKTQNGAAVEIKLTAADLAAAVAGKDKGLVLGRSTAMSDRTIDDQSVSRRHARLAGGADGLTIEDLNSAYGTAVNGQRLAAFTPTTINPGDSVALGGVTLALKAG
jgi:hypothetical protein